MPSLEWRQVTKVEAQRWYHQMLLSTTQALESSSFIQREPGVFMLSHFIFMKEKLSGLLDISCYIQVPCNVIFSKAKWKHVVVAKEKIKYQIISYFEFLFHTKGISDPKENMWKQEAPNEISGISETLISANVFLMNL